MVLIGILSSVVVDGVSEILLVEHGEMVTCAFVCTANCKVWKHSFDVLRTGNEDS